MINKQDPVGSQRTVQSSKNKWKLCWRLTTLWLSCSVNPRTEYWIKKNPELHGIKHHCGINSLCLFKNCVGLPANCQTLGLTRYHLFPTFQLLDRSNIICCLPANLQSQADTNTISSIPANSVERWLYVTDWSGSNLHCITQQSAYPSVMISGLRGKVWQIRFLGRLRVALKTNGQQK